MEVNPVAMMGVSVAITAAVSFVATMYWTKRGERGKAATETAEALVERDRRISELERKLSEVGTTVQPLSAAFQAMLIKQLTHMHTPELDALLSKLGPPDTLTPDEETKLAAGLLKRSEDLNGRISDSEREAAIMLPFVIKRVREEAHITPDPGNLSLVVVPPVDGKKPVVATQADEVVKEAKDEEDEAGKSS